MTLPNTLLLGFIAGATILLGLPVGRMRRLSAGVRTLLSAVAVGILLFLVWDVLSAAWEPIDAALKEIHDQHTGYGPLTGYGALFVGGLTVGLLGLVGYERSSKRLAVRPADG